jgi:hypothetical protein
LPWTEQAVHDAPVPDAKSAATEAGQNLQTRASAAIALGGVLLLLVAMGLWLSAGSAEIVGSIHHVGAIMLGSIGFVLLITGLVLSPSATQRNVSD